MKPRIVLFSLVMCASGLAAAETKLTVTPLTAHPGDPVLVTVAGAKEAPNGTASGKRLEFFPARGGFQAVFAIPLETKEDKISVEVDTAKRGVDVKVVAQKFPETSVIVEEEMASPDKPDRDRIDADNKAIIDATLKAKGDPQFTRAFRRPRGGVTSVFGEWRTFNDGHRSQHLGIDLFAKEGSRVGAVDAGTVTLVLETFLAGNVVVIAHGGGLATAYYHLSKTSVAEGDVVEQGKEIGLAGHTGRTTGPHLHLSVRVPGGFVDPAAFFKLPIAPKPAATARR